MSTTHSTALALPSNQLRLVRLAAGRTRWQLLKVARSLEVSATTVAARGDGNEARRLRALAAQHRAAAPFGRWF